MITFDPQTPWLDYDFWIRLVAAGARVLALPCEHFFHRRQEPLPQRSGYRTG